MDDREFNRERRKQGRLRELGTHLPRCTCGETDWRCFDAVSNLQCVNCRLKATATSNQNSKKARLKTLGTHQPICAMCGESDWRCIESHHVAGRKRDRTTVLLCANDHRRVTDSQKEHPISMSADDQLLDQIAHFLLGLADMLRVVTERLIEFANALISRAQKAEHTPF
jgi:hypothetical protein